MRVICKHCGKSVAPVTEWRHLAGQASGTLNASLIADDSAERRIWLTGSHPAKRHRKMPPEEAPPTSGSSSTVDMGTGEGTSVVQNAGSSVDGARLIV